MSARAVTQWSFAALQPKPARSHTLAGMAGCGQFPRRGTNAARGHGGRVGLSGRDIVCAPGGHGPVGGGAGAVVHPLLSGAGAGGRAGNRDPDIAVRRAAPCPVRLLRIPVRTVSGRAVRHGKRGAGHECPPARGLTRALVVGQASAEYIRHRPTAGGHPVLVQIL